MDIQNQEALTDIFGQWPSFHDAEVLSLTLDRGGEEGPSLMARIHLWRMIDQVDAKGYYVLEDHTLATLRFDGIVFEHLSGFNHQNALLDLEITEVGLPVDGNERCNFEVVLDAAHGVDGMFKCRTISVVSAEPYQPQW